MKTTRNKISLED